MSSTSVVKFHEAAEKRRLAASYAGEFKKNGDLILWSWYMREAKKAKAEQRRWGSRIIFQSC